MKWTDILKVIQIPKVNLNVKDLSNANKEPEDDKCRKELIAFTDKLKVIIFPFSGEAMNYDEFKVSGDEATWSNTVYRGETENFKFNGNNFHQQCKYEIYIHNRRIKDGMDSSNLPEEVACRILELFDEHRNEKHFNIEEEIQGFRIEYDGVGGHQKTNTQNLYFDERDEEGNHKLVPEVRTVFFNHNLSVYNPKGLEILEIETALWLSNVLSSGAGAYELQYNKEAKELFMWFPNVIFSFIHHYVNLGNMFSWFKRGLLK
tara:strand:- start:24428 stop:25210 length:783 start_codon:yes stop_codon:yes gene_type:complete